MSFPRFFKAGWGVEMLMNKLEISFSSISLSFPPSPLWVTVVAACLPLSLTLTS